MGLFPGPLSAIRQLAPASSSSSSAATQRIKFHDSNSNPIDHLTNGRRGPIWACGAQTTSGNSRSNKPQNIGARIGSRIGGQSLGSPRARGLLSRAIIPLHSLRSTVYGLPVSQSDGRSGGRAVDFGKSAWRVNEQAAENSILSGLQAPHPAETNNSLPLSSACGRQMPLGDDT